jgi:hypothetical protein
MNIQTQNESKSNSTAFPHNKAKEHYETAAGTYAYTSK